MTLLDEHFLVINARLGGQLTRYACERVEITPVAEHYYVTDSRTDWRLEDYASLAPPFKRAWWEWRMPSQVNMDGDVHTIPGAARRQALYRRALELMPDEAARLTGEDAVRLLNEEHARDPFHLRGASGETFAARVGFAPRWLLFDYFFAEGRARGVSLLLVVVIPVSEDGRMVSTDALMTSADVPLSLEDLEAFSGLIHPVHFATNLLHCKNVALETRRAPFMETQRVRRRTGRAPLRFKVLTIEPMAARRKAADARAEAAGAARETLVARHLRRGHWRDYRRGAGLFGRHKGLFWFGEHEAGGDDSAVQKSYIIKPRS